MLPRFKFLLFATTLAVAPLLGCSQKEAPTAPALYPGEERDFPLGNTGTTIRMCWIPAGSYIMGSPDEEWWRRDDEGQAHRVTLMNGFWMGKYEVTGGQWNAVLGSNPEHEDARGAEYPVNSASWEDVQKLEAALGDTFRLPSEAEWEYACRAGTTTRFYWGGGDGDNYAWTYQNSDGFPLPVGQKLPNAWGLYDMSGNVWEWCEDYYHDSYNYPSRPDDGRPWTDSPPDSSRVLRGGSVDYYVDGDVRSAARFKSLPEWGTQGGFRLVYSLISR